MDEAEKPPIRPETKIQHALEALELFVIGEMAHIAATRPNGHAFLEAARAGALSGFSKNPLPKERQEVADHLDWLYASAGVGARRMTG